MKYLTAYAIFVMQASEAGCEIEASGDGLEWLVLTPKELTWNWSLIIFRIKLPEGWEYVIEDGDIAFREPKKGESYFGHTVFHCVSDDYVGKRPIIKRIGKGE